MTTLKTLLTICFLALATAACDGGGPDPNEPLAPGIYPLVRVEAISNLIGGGSGIPVTFTDGAGIEMSFNEEAVLDLDEGGHYDFFPDLSLNDTDFPDLHFTGTYQQNGSSISFTDDTDAEDNMTATIEDGGIVAQHNSVAGLSFRFTFAFQ